MNAEPAKPAEHQRIAITAAIALVVALAPPASLSAKGNTTRIIIAGADLSAPIEIVDPEILKHFNVWAGPGVRINDADQMDGFIADWRSGADALRPSGLRHYDVSFYVKERVQGPEQLAYVVSYDCSPDATHGYVYVPGAGHDRYRLNTRSIFRGNHFEGHWFRATSVWQQVAASLIGTRDYHRGRRRPGRQQHHRVPSC